MLLDVLTRFCQDTGIHIVNQRTLALRYINNAAAEIYKQLECNKIYRECSILVPADKIVSLPAYIGELRGMRIHTNEIPFDLHSMSAPRYVSTTWNYKFRNWRDLSESAIKRSLNDVAPLNITCIAVETSPITVLISGQTDRAQKEEESVVLDSVSKNTTKSFGPAIYNISCSRARTNDISVKDVNGNEIAVLFNTMNETRYKIVDVSRLPWPLDTPDSQSIIDVLYKHPLLVFTNDSDKFPSGSEYDDAWYYMSMHMYFRPQQGREQDASANRAQAEAALVSLKDTSEQNIVKKISYGRNKYYGLFKRYRYFPGTVTNVDIPSVPPAIN